MGVRVPPFAPFVSIGVGSQAETLTASLTKTDTTLGTLAYMSPEQLRGEEVVVKKLFGVKY